MDLLEGHGQKVRWTPHMPCITGQPEGAAGAHGSAYTCDERGAHASRGRRIVNTSGAWSSLTRSR